jgi:hypothetical protein
VKLCRIVSLAALLCFGSLVVAGAADNDTAAVGALEENRCCFENPRFSGTCEVAPGPEETCSDVLAYLNNPNSVGKNYCGNTKVRGGWTQVPCQGAATSGEDLLHVRTCRSPEGGSE